MPNLEDELTCIFVEVITVDPPVPAIDAKTIVLRSSAAGAAWSDARRPDGGGAPPGAPPPRQRALLRYSEGGSAPSDEAQSRRAMTVPDARRRSQDVLAIEQHAEGGVNGVADHILWGAPLFLTGFLAAFCAAALVFLTPTWSPHVRDLANHARHSVGLYAGR